MILKRISFVIFFAGCFALEMFSSLHVQQKIEKWGQRSCFKNGSVAVEIIRSSDGVVEGSFRSSEKMVPASVLKLLVTGVALETLGEDYKFKTKLFYRGSIKDGVLNGDVILKGGGDPTLPLRISPSVTLAEHWREALYGAGIRHIRGEILIDPSVFEPEPVSPYWAWCDIGNYYGAGSFGLNINNNEYTLTLQSSSIGEIPLIKQMNPQIPDFSVSVYAHASTVKRDSLYIYSSPFAHHAFIMGAIPFDSKMNIKGSIPNPPLLAGTLLVEALQKRDMVSKKAVPQVLWQQGLTVAEYDSMQLVDVVYSPPLKEIVRRTNFFSNNLYAETLLRHLGEGSQGKGREFILSFLHNRGWDTSSLSLYDGSGLSVQNRISCRIMNRFLRYMLTQSPCAVSFRSSLPLAGKEGTVKNVFSDSLFEGSLRLKSGTLSGSRNYAGEMIVGDHSYIFTIMINELPLSSISITKEIEELLRILYPLL